ncbi:CrcB family protein [Microbacter sp. GSS18]|nr:CrcB family protein [Microbacter sp. GSS18]
MNIGQLLLIALTGGIGAGLRYSLDRWLTRVPGEFPRGILVVNVSGSLALGIVTGLGAAVLPAGVLAVIGTGLLGGYTTFSTVCVESVLIAQRRRRREAIANLLGTLALAVIAAGVGLATGLWAAGLAG